MVVFLALSDPVLGGLGVGYSISETRPGAPVEFRDANDRVTSYAYGDALDRLTLVTHPIGTTAFSYGPAANNNSVTTTKKPRRRRNSDGSMPCKRSTSP